MYNKIDLKRITLLLIIVFLGTAAAASFLFFSQYGSAIGSETIFSEEMKGGIKVDEEKTEALQGLNNITIKADCEDLRIIPDGSNEVKAHLYGYYNSSDNTNKPELLVERAGSVLTIKVKWTKDFHLFFFTNNMKMDVYVPKEYAEELNLSSDSGNIYAEGLSLKRYIMSTDSGNIKLNLIKTSEVDLKTSSGNAIISGICDSLKFQSDSGRFEATGFSSKTSTLKSSSGNIEISGVPGDLKAKTDSGKVELQYTDFTNKLDIETYSGDVNLKLPDNAGFNLDFNSDSGDISNDFPITTSGNKDDDNNSLNGTVGSGNGSIKVRTDSGSLSITK